MKLQLQIKMNQALFIRNPEQSELGKNIIQHSIQLIDKNGFEHILQFAPSGWWIGDMQSMIKQEPGMLYIDAVDDTEIILVQKTDLQDIYATIPKLERFFRILAENALATYQHRLIDNLSLPAIERYQNFCRQYPSLTEILPQKQVAAYIGVTPEFLSKMLGKAAAKK